MFPRTPAFCDAGTDENDLCLRHAALYIHRVSYHRRHDGSQILPQLGKVLFNKKVQRRTGRGYDNILLCLAQHPLVFALDYRRAYGGLLGVGEAKLYKCLAHGVCSAALPAGIEGRVKARYHGRFALKHHADPLAVINDLLCLLRTDNKTLAAQDALVAYYMCLMPREADRLDRAFSYASVTILAV